MLPLSGLAAPTFSGTICQFLRYKMNPAQWDMHQEGYETAFASFTTLFGIDGINLANLPTTSALKCIDIACGPGNLSLELAKRGHQVAAVDYSPKMVDSLRSKMEAHRCNESHHQYTSLVDPSKYSHSPIECLVANGEDLSVFSDNTFDVAVSNFGIYLFPNRDEGFRAAYRVLKPDSGILIATSWDASYLPLQAGRKIKEALGFPAVNKPVSFIPDVHTFENEMKQIGFRELKIYNATHEFVCSSGESFLNSMIGNPLIAGIKDPSHQGIAKRILLETVRGIKIEEKDLADSDAVKEPVHFPSPAHICIAKK